LCAIMPSIWIFCRKSMFIMTWTLNQKYSWRSYRC
jgi:hypothetical protein